MITFVLVAVGAIVVIGLVILVMNSGRSGGRNGQSGRAEVRAQQEETKARGDVRSTGGDD